MKKILLPKVLFIIFIFSGIFFATYATASAQVLISFEAKNFTPRDYIGKNLPIKNTLVEVGFELILENKIQDLGQSRIFWYLDEKLIQRGNGLKQIAFRTDNPVGSPHFVRIVVNHKNREYENTLIVPIVEPKIIFTTPKFLLVGENVISAAPYFFNAEKIEDLNFLWFINAEEKSREQKLILNLKPPLPVEPELLKINIALAITNKQNPLEVKRQVIDLLVKYE